MKILIIGSGGRENAIAYAVKKSKIEAKIYCAPGNGGTEDIAVNVPIKQDDVKGLLDFALKNKIDLTVTGPEIPLSLGIVDEFTAAGLKIFGPNKKASLLESSKKFAKDFLKKYNIKTAGYESFDDLSDAENYVKNNTHPLVIKASGLAAGKGVFISKDAEESKKILNSIFIGKIFGKSGDTVVIEDYLDGFELSYMIVTDGISYKPLITSMDYKKIGEGDTGENTGGMGAITPNPYVSEDLINKINKNVIEPSLEGLKKEGIKYKGILYAGLMIKGDDIFVLEYNVRFGDPETQAILIRLESDIIELFLSVINENLKDYDLIFDNKDSLCLVLASGGYPKDYKTGYVITFDKKLHNSGLVDKNAAEYYIFHAGTKKTGGQYLTDGGRVLNICAKGEGKEIIKAVYDIAKMIDFKDKYYRKDIGKTFN
ncbi:MAG: phosphoribosylamine--glycine ligase [Candidatus Acidulodesulfobacterium sp.]